MKFARQKRRAGGDDELVEVTGDTLVVDVLARAGMSVEDLASGIGGRAPKSETESHEAILRAARSVA